MTPTEILQTWNSLLDSEQITQEQGKSLLLYINENKTAASVLAEDLAVHRMLKMKQDPKLSADQFVENCMRRLKTKSTSSTIPAIDTVVESPQINIHTEPTTTALPISGSRAKRKSQSRRWAIALLSLASAIVIGCFVWIWQGQQNQIESIQREEDTSTAVPESAPEPASLVDSDPVVPADSPQLPTIDDIEPNEPPEPREELIAGNNSASPIALLQFNNEAVWDSNESVQPGAIEAGQYNLKSGLAVLEFTPGQSLALFGPASVQLSDDSAVMLISGKFLIESDVEGEGEMVEFETRDIRISKLNAAQVQLLVDSTGSEVLLSAGEFELQRKSSTENPLNMKQDELERAFFNNVAADPTNNEKAEEPVVIAAGPQKYFAQIGLGEQKKTSRSASEFQAFMQENMADSKIYKNKLQRFDELFNDLRRQFNESPSEDLPGFSLQSISSDDDKRGLDELRGKLKSLLKR